MAVVVNERDVLIQGAPERVVDVPLPGNIVVPALQSLSLSAPALTFHVDDADFPTPAAITLTATLRGMPEGTAVTWDVVAGTATLTGTGLSRTLAYADKSTDSVSVRAQATSGGMTYSDTLTFVTVRDGTSGTSGARGSLSVARSITGSVWSDAEALAALVAAGVAGPVATDTCCLFNISTRYSELRRYTGSAWVDVGATMPGSSMMAQSITVEKLLVTGLGMALNSDPNTEDVTGWTGSGISIVQDATAPNGTTALRCAGASATVLSKRFPIDALRNFRVRTWVRQESGSSTAYLLVNFMDAAGNTLPGSTNPAGWASYGSYHYYGLVNQAPANTWEEKTVSFGPDEVFHIPTGAKYASIGLLSNYSGSGVQLVCGMHCHLKTTGDMVVEGTITADALDTRGLIIRDLAGNPILGAGNALDWAMVGGAGRPEDGATVGAMFGVNIGGKISPANSSTYIEDAAINSALIANASVRTAHIEDLNVTTAKVKGNAIVAPAAASVISTISQTSSGLTGAVVSIATTVDPEGYPLFVMGSFVATNTPSSAVTYQNVNVKVHLLMEGMTLENMWDEVLWDELDPAVIASRSLRWSRTVTKTNDATTLRFEDSFTLSVSGLVGIHTLVLIATAGAYNHPSSYPATTVSLLGDGDTGILGLVVKNNY